MINIVISLFAIIHDTTCILSYVHIHAFLNFSVYSTLQYMYNVHIHV